MAWIKTIKFEDADQNLRELLRQLRKGFPAEYATPVEGASSINESIVDSHTLIPPAMFHAFATLSSLTVPELPLDRRQHEIIATVVSAANNCHYWLESHAEFLRRATHDDDLVEGLRSDYENAPITDAERVMCDYVIQLTKNAVKITPRHHEMLRAAGFNDTAILQMTLIASWFNYINRVADALGVGRDEEFPAAG